VTKDEFIKEYCHRSNVEWKVLSEHQVALPCACRIGECKGWAMVSRSVSSILTHLELYGPKLQEWQPIASAPKDGDLVDLWVDGERQANCFWQEKCFCQEDEESGEWRQQYVESPGTSFKVQGEPTHWRSLPDSPIY
jgi:hypothetical protein